MDNSIRKRRKGKVGVAGRGINTSDTLDEFLESKGDFQQ